MTEDHAHLKFLGHSVETQVDGFAADNAMIVVGDHSVGIDCNAGWSFMVAPSARGIAVKVISQTFH